LPGGSFTAQVARRGRRHLQKKKSGGGYVPGPFGPIFNKKKEKKVRKVRITILQRKTVLKRDRFPQSGLRKTYNGTISGQWTSQNPVQRRGEMIIEDRTMLLSTHTTEISKEPLLRKERLGGGRGGGGGNKEERRGRHV